MANKGRTRWTSETAPRGFRERNGRKFGKRFGRKGGKARWAKMSQEEKELIWAKRDYALQQNNRLKAKMSKMSLTIPKRALKKEEIEEYEEFFGDIL